jgi:hypothetical protein
VLQIDPHACPRGRSSAHRINEHVGRLEVRGRIRVTRLPAGEAFQRIFLSGGSPNFD